MPPPASTTISSSTTHLTEEEVACEEHFRSTHQRDDTGRFIVELPFKKNAPELGASKFIAMKRAKQMEKRLASRPIQQQQYSDVIKEYINFGWMEEVPEEELNKNDKDSYYLPHHAVFKESSVSTKTRLVYNGSSKTSSGISLNDVLMVGPKKQDDILPLLLRVRIHLIALLADIRKMYPQFRLKKKHIDFHRLIWRFSPSELWKVYCLLVVTFGIASAPHTAVSCLQQLAEDEADTLPRAAEKAKGDFFMDNLVSGAKDHEEATELYSQLMEMMKAGGMELTQWASNSSKIMDEIPASFRAIESTIQFDQDDMLKTLGVQWSPTKDTFSFKVCLPSVNQTLTKRTLLSNIAKLFDPLGIIAPVTVKAKILMQSLWKEKLGWDDPLPPIIIQEWQRYQHDLPAVEKVDLNRCVLTSSSSSIQLCGFSDASEAAYAAVVYARCQEPSGQWKVTLLCSKTRVAPIQTISIPRMELAASKLLTELMELVKNSLQNSIEIEKVFYWTDSMVVLSWLSSPPCRWATFVANRTSKILETATPSSWSHVAGKENPADCASRGIFASQLIDHELWWSGPRWLATNDWPMTQALTSTNLEERKVKVHHTQHSHFTTDLMTKFSLLPKIQRVTALVMRFIHNCRAQKNERDGGNLSLDEMNASLLLLIKCTQAEMFQEEFRDLKVKKMVSHKSKLYHLNPFLDDKKVLRVGGRLSKSALTEAQKFPIVLPQQHPFVTMLIRNYHFLHLHAGPQLLLATLRENYWILRGKDAVRNIVRKCVRCNKLRANLGQQMMADLPSARVQPSPPFEKSMVDFCGPILVKIPKIRTTRSTQTTYKGYISVFVCMVTKAVHLELVDDLTGESFIAALRRFVSRRGLCLHLYSDNGSNFHGAERELREMIEETAPKILHFSTTNGIRWHWSPPGGPHFSGLVEAAVKSTKYHLRRVIGIATLTYDELNTLLTQVEACLNSRPLTSMSNDPSDLTVLTPGHFLIGRPLTALPEENYLDTKENLLSRWQLIQQMTQSFWRRWSMEYLVLLQNRPKWNQPRRNLEPGMMVIMKDDNLPPLKWKMARVLTVHPGSDDLVRVATVKTQNGELTRPIHKLVLLPVHEESSTVGSSDES